MAEIRYPTSRLTEDNRGDIDHDVGTESFLGEKTLFLYVDSTRDFRTVQYDGLCCISNERSSAIRATRRSCQARLVRLKAQNTEIGRPVSRNA